MLDLARHGEGAQAGKRTRGTASAFPSSAHTGAASPSSYRAATFALAADPASEDMRRCCAGALRAPQGRAT